MSTTDPDGNVVPLMLSSLVQLAQETLAIHGDMPVGVEGRKMLYDDTVTTCGPVSDPPLIESPGWLRDWWPEKFNAVFVLVGEDG